MTSQKPILAIEQLDLQPYEKVPILLTYLKLNPATNLHLFTDPWVNGEAPKSIHPRVTPIATNLRSIGLAVRTEEAIIHYDLLAMKGRTDMSARRVRIWVGQNEALLDSLYSAWYSGDAAATGRAYGYPETAVIAYAQRNRMPFEAIPNDIKSSPAYHFAGFRFSIDHWQDELAIGQTWANAVQAASPKLYREYLDQLRNIE